MGERAAPRPPTGDPRPRRLERRRRSVSCGISSFATEARRTRAWERTHVGLDEHQIRTAVDLTSHCPQTVPVGLVQRVTVCLVQDSVSNATKEIPADKGQRRPSRAGGRAAPPHAAALTCHRVLGTHLLPQLVQLQIPIQYLVCRGTGGVADNGVVHCAHHGRVHPWGEVGISAARPPLWI